MSITFWFCAIVTGVSVLTSLGFSIAALRSTEDTYISALYALSRSLALAVVTIVAIFASSRSWLLAVATAMTIVQVMDGYVGVKQRDIMKTAGPLFLGGLNLVALILLARS